MPSSTPQKSSHRFLKYSERALFGLVMMAVVTVPLFVDRRLSNWHVMPKQYWFAGIVLAALIGLALQLVISKKIALRYSLIDCLVVAFVGAVILSSSFSVSPPDSFFGRSEYFSLNAAYVLILACWYFVVVRMLTSARRWRALTDAIIAAGGVSALLFIAALIPAAARYLAPFSILGNVIEASPSSLGLWLTVIFMLAAGAALRRGSSAVQTALYIIVAGLAAVGLVLLNIKLVWWLFLGGVALILLLGISYARGARLSVLVPLFVLLPIIIIVTVFNIPKAWRIEASQEIMLRARPSWSITSKTIFSSLKNFTLGSGPGTFVYDFSLFRSANFNSDSVAWHMRFNQPASTALALLGETGVMGGALFLVIILLTTGHLFVTWRGPGSGADRSAKERSKMKGAALTAGPALDNERFDLAVVGFSWLLLTIGAGAALFGSALWFLWWLLLGLVIGGLFLLNRDFGSVFESDLSQAPEYNLVFSFLIILVTALLVLGGARGALWYRSELNFARALATADSREAERLLQEALTGRPKSDRYHMTLAEVYFNRAVAKSREKEPDALEINRLLAAAVNNARQAADISPRSALVVTHLATMYENAAPLVPEARGWAIDSLLKAKTLEPTNPVIEWRLGNNYALAKESEKARLAYRSALELKPDYADAHSALATLYEQEGKTAEAINIYQKAATVTQGNAEILFNWGRLLYNRNASGDRALSESLWKQVVTSVPNYSNAWYSLGLAAEARGDKAAALKYYIRVQELNPDNQEVLKKVSALGGSAPTSTPR